MRHKPSVPDHSIGHRTGEQSARVENHYGRNLHLSKTLGVYLCVSSIVNNDLTLTGELEAKCQSQDTE